ncbi:zinc finger protein [Sesbania bispinosa]|nr:zinc finger protein [Sesbania bispinosa]
MEVLAEGQSSSPSSKNSLVFVHSVSSFVSSPSVPFSTHKNSSPFALFLIRDIGKDSTTKLEWKPSLHPFNSGNFRFMDLSISTTSGFFKKPSSKISDIGMHSGIPNPISSAMEMAIGMKLENHKTKALNLLRSRICDREAQGGYYSLNRNCIDDFSDTDSFLLCNRCDWEVHGGCSEDIIKAVHDGGNDVEDIIKAVAIEVGAAAVHSHD